MKGFFMEFTGNEEHLKVVKSGNIKAINKLNRSLLKEVEKLQLAGANLEGADLEGADLEGADLQWAHLEGADLQWAHLEGAHLEGVHLKGAYGLNDIESVDRIVFSRDTQISDDAPKFMQELKAKADELPDDEVAQLQGDKENYKIVAGKMIEGKFVENNDIKQEIKTEEIKEPSFKKRFKESAGYAQDKTNIMGRYTNRPDPAGDGHGFGR
jgi:hypothetical protein